MAGPPAASWTTPGDSRRQSSLWARLKDISKILHQTASHFPAVKFQHPPTGRLIAIHHRQGEGFVVVIESFGGERNEVGDVRGRVSAGRIVAKASASATDPASRNASLVHFSPGPRWLPAASETRQKRTG